MLKYVNKDNFENEVLKSNEVILVDFFATWCGPCQMLGPVLEMLSNEQNDFDIVKINVDEAQEIAINYGIQVVPTMIVFKEGNVVDRMEGFFDKIEILEKLSKYMNK